MNDTLKQIVALINPPSELEKVRNALVGGKNMLLHNVVSETISLDTQWIDEIETGLFHIEKIVKEPKTFIKEEEYIVDVEKAKKTNSRTVRHLASHTRNIANVEANGDIRPKRVLTIENEEDLGIYENRFIVALIDRLQIFVEKRYKEINEKMSKFNVTTIKVDSEFPYGKANVQYNLSVVMKEPPIEKGEVQKNIENLARIDAMRKRIRILTNTALFRKLKNLKPVRPPIAKTNILKMNVDYHTAYKLWLYISAYTFVGYSVETQDKNLPIDGDYYDDLTMIAGMSVKCLIDSDKERKDVYKELAPKKLKQKKYKVLTKVDFNPSFKQDNGKLHDDTVNEFYYNQIKQALQQAVEMPEDYDLVQEKELDVSFTKFVRALGKINFDMYEEIIQKHSYAATTKDEKPKTKTFLVKQQEKIYKRYLMLSKLKSAELEKALRAESREYLKLEKMKADFNFQTEVDDIMALKAQAEAEIAEQEAAETPLATENVVAMQKPQSLTDDAEIKKLQETQKTKEKQIIKRKASGAPKPKKEKQPLEIKEKIEKAKKKADTKVEKAKEKSKTTLEKKVVSSRNKTKDLKQELFLKDQERLVQIAERNEQRKKELQKRRENK